MACRRLCRPGYLPWKPASHNSSACTPLTRSRKFQFTIEEIREFLQRKTQEFADILAGDPETARTQLRKRISKLVLTPKETPGGFVFEVTGDVNLFQGNDDVMLTNSLEGIAEHYIGASISLAGVILDPSLPLAV